MVAPVGSASAFCPELVQPVGQRNASVHKFVGTVLQLEFDEDIFVNI